MFKSLILASIIGLSPVVLTDTVDAPAEQEVVEEKACKVIDNTGEHGTIFCDIEEGDVGDIVTFIVTPEMFYSAEYVKVNDVVINPVVEGGKKYSFALAEGENVITASFVIDNEKVAEVMKYVNLVKEEGWESLFTVDNLMKLIGYVFGTSGIIAFCITQIKLKKIKSVTQTSTETTVTNTLNSILEQFLTATISRVLEAIDKKIDVNNAELQQMKKCFLLMAENTPESRLAIINEISKNNSQDDLTKQIKTIIAEEMEARNIKQEEIDNAITEMKEANDEMGKIETGNGNEGDDIGTL